MKTKEQVRVEGRPVVYALLYNSMKKAALDLGYALALHGTMHSDMDLIAVAWVEDAKPVEDLVKAINDCIGATIWKDHNLATGEDKPHGRLSYVLSIFADWHIDLSIIPPVTAAKEADSEWAANLAKWAVLVQKKNSEIDRLHDVHLNYCETITYLQKEAETLYPDDYKKRWEHITGAAQEPNTSTP